MAAHPGLHALTAAALTGALMAARWWTRRRADSADHGASAARAPWRRTPPCPTGAHTAHARVAELHAALLDPAAAENNIHFKP